MERKDAYVGMKLYRERGKDIQEYTVSKVLNKYLECDGLHNKITISSLKYENKEYSQCNFQMYLSKQDILDIKDKLFLSNRIRKCIGQYGNINYPLEILRKIDELLTQN